MKVKNSFFSLILIFLFIESSGQIDGYIHQRDILGVEDTWHTFTLPTDIWQNINSSASDIRVIGIDDQQDTFEAPFFVEVQKPIVEDRQMEFEVVNRSSVEGTAHYFTLKMAKVLSVNSIDLRFDNENFDWKVALEGSQDNTNWFSIVKEARILSINTDQTHFSHTSLAFSKSEYKYYRVGISSEEVPNLSTASVSFHESSKVDLADFSIRKIEKELSKKDQNSVYFIELDSYGPVSSVEMLTTVATDFIRPVQVSALIDSFHTEKGWKYNYQNIIRGNFSSFKKNVFLFSEIRTNKLKVVIENGDNSPVDVGRFLVSGYNHIVTARFDKPARYYLVYGKESARFPSYDISLFKQKIPKKIHSLDLGEAISSEIEEINEPKDESKIWLWIVMGVAIVLMGLFTLKMMKNQ